MADQISSTSCIGYATSVVVSKVAALSSLKPLQIQQVTSHNVYPHCFKLHPWLRCPLPVVAYSYIPLQKAEG